jgi:hypothetical protein
VAGFLGETRRRAVALRAKVDAFNEARGRSGEDMQRFIAYVGQTVLKHDASGGKE